MTERDDNGAPPTLDALLAELPRERAPERDVWPAIAAEIAPRRRLWSWQPFVSAAAAATVVIVLWQTLPPAEQEAAPELADMPRDAGLLQALPADFIEAEAGFLRVREHRYADIEARLAQLPVETRETIERSLDSIATALLDLREALAEEPLDPVLQHLLLQLYTQELAVLGQLDHSTRLVDERRIEL